MVQFRDDYDKAKKIGERPKISEYLGVCILTIAQRVATKPCFNGYTFKDEMIADGIENCIMYMHNFDPTKYNNPFAYFTQIIIYAFVRRIQKEKKQQCIKIKNIQNHFIMEELTDEKVEVREIYQNNQEYLKNYEESLTKKKKSAKKVGLEKFIEVEEK